MVRSAFHGPCYAIIMPGLLEARINFLFLFCLLNLFLIEKLFNITKFKVENMVPHLILK
jgi:hypothetical protein